MSTEEAAKIVKVLTGMLAIAKLAMPDTYYATDSRVKAAKALIGKYKPKKPKTS